MNNTDKFPIPGEDSEMVFMPPTVSAHQLSRVAIGNFALQSDRVLTRLDPLQNQCAANGMGAELVKPDPHAIEKIEREDPRITYFATPNFEDTNMKSFGDPEFARTIFQPLIERVKLDLPNHNRLAFRGIMASINGTLDFNYGHSNHIADVVEVVKRGGDRVNSGFNVASADMTERTTDVSLSLDRVNQYAAGTSFRRFDISGEAPEVAEALFPAVLVYDYDALEKIRGGVYQVRVKNGVEASEAILKAYILDCPK